MKKEKQKIREIKKCWHNNYNWQYPCSDGFHDSFWKTITESPQWAMWKKEVARRMSRSKTYIGVWDVDECHECGWISMRHFQDFIKFITKTK